MAQTLPSFARHHSKLICALLLLVFACIAAAAMTGCSSYQSVDEAKQATSNKSSITSTALLQDGVLTVGVNENSAPYAWVIDDETGTLSGYDVQIAIALADQMGLKVKFVNTDQASSAGNTCDIVMGCNAASASDGSIVVIGSYADSAAAVFTRNPSGIVTLDDLAVGVVGVQTDSTSSVVLARIAPQIQPVSYATISDAFDALANGSVTYVVCDSFLGGYVSSMQDDIAFAGALELPTTRGIGVSSNNIELQQAIQDALDIIQSNGIATSIRTSYVGDLPTITSDNQIAGTSVQTEETAEVTDEATDQAAEVTDEATEEAPVEDEAAGEAEAEV